MCMPKMEFLVAKQVCMGNARISVAIQVDANGGTGTPTRRNALSKFKRQKKNYTSRGSFLAHLPVQAIVVYITLTTGMYLADT